MPSGDYGPSNTGSCEIKLSNYAAKPDYVKAHKPRRVHDVVLLSCNPALELITITSTELVLPHRSKTKKSRSRNLTARHPHKMCTRLLRYARRCMRYPNDHATLSGVQRHAQTSIHSCYDT